MFFTRPILGDRILDNLEKTGVAWSEARIIIDLACGGAAFLAPAARRIADTLTARGDSAEDVLIHRVGQARFRMRRRLTSAQRTDLSDDLCQAGYQSRKLTRSEEKGGRHLPDGALRHQRNISYLDVSDGVLLEADKPNSKRTHAVVDVDSFSARCARRRSRCDASRSNLSAMKSKLI